jgi:hypothetical protein
MTPAISTIETQGDVLEEGTEEAIKRPSRQIVIAAAVQVVAAVLSSDDRNSLR